jgi:hypothetical protein
MRWPQNANTLAANSRVAVQLCITNAAMIENRVCRALVRQTGLVVQTGSV